MALPVLESYTTDKHTGSGEGSVTLTVPAGATTGETLIFLIADDTSATSSPIATPSGLTKKIEVGTSTSDVHLLVYERVVDGTEPASYTFTDGNEFSSMDVIGYCLRISNYDSFDGIVGDEVSSSSSIAIGDLTTTAADCLLIAGVAYDGADASPLFTSATNSFTKEAEDNSRGTGSFGVTLGFFTRDVTSTGTYNTTVTPDGTDGMSGAVLAIAGGAGGGGGGITYVGGDIKSGDDATDKTPTLPAHEANDFGIIYGRADETGTVPTLGVSTTGWTELRQDNFLGGRDRVEAIFYRRFTSSSETNPVCTIDTAEEHSFSVSVFRGVDTTTAFDVTEVADDGINNTVPTNPAITTVTDNAAVILLHGTTGNDITVAGAPTDYTLGPTLVSSGNINRGQFVAYNLDAGTAGTVTPGAWTHTSSPTDVAEYSTYTIALRPQAAAGAVVSTAGSGSTNIDGQTPTATATDNKASTATAGATGISGAQPVATATANQVATAASGGVETSGQIGVASATANVDAYATAGGVGITGSTPTASTTAAVDAIAASGSTSLAGATPTATTTANVSASAVSGAVDTSGATPTAVATANVDSRPTPGAAEIVGAQPTARASTGAEAIADSGAASITGSTPVATSTANVVAIADYARVNIAGQAATAGVGVVARPGAGTLTVVGQSAVSAAGAGVQAIAGQGAVSLIGAVPTATATSETPQVTIQFSVEGNPASSPVLTGSPASANLTGNPAPRAQVGE